METEVYLMAWIGVEKFIKYLHFLSMKKGVDLKRG